MSRSLRSLRDDRGVVALEVVLVMPVLLMLIIGTVVLGVFLGGKAQTIGFAHEGARAASLGLPIGDVPVDVDTELTYDVGPCPTGDGFVTVRATKPVSLRSIPFVPVLLKENHSETATFPCAP